MLALRDLPTSFIDILNIITRNTDKIFEIEETNNKYSSILMNYRKKNLEVNFSFFNPSILNMFQTYYYYQWIEEGITIQTMRKYGIRFSVNKNQIIIPHYNSDSQLIGIRCRNLGELDLLNGNKYMPVRIEGKWYSHSLSYNLYGLNFTKEAITKKKMAFIFEGE